MVYAVLSSQHGPADAYTEDLTLSGADVVEQLIYTYVHFGDEHTKYGIFRNVSRQLYLNLCAASNFAPDEEHPRPFVRASEYKGPDLIETYLCETPYLDYFQKTTSLHVPAETYFSHMHVVGGSGAGKTQWLSELILYHLKSDDRPSLVVVDSQGDLIRELARLQDVAERAILITPKDILHPPDINIFDMNQRRLHGYSEVDREQVIAGAIQTFDYLFSGIIGADLTAKQSVFFRFVARLMLTLPETMGRNATILDMLALMEDPTPYQDAIKALPPIQRQFFERDFTSKTFQQTKEQVRYRLHAILENPTLARLFTSQHTRIDLFEALNSGNIILIDTAKDFLKGASPHFGRIFIALVLQAILERSVLTHRHPTYLIVDEAHEYFDQNIDDLLTQARKYKTGCTFAHQYLGQCTSELKASLATNTSIKLGARLSAADARALAPELRTTPEFIASLPRLHFACFIRDVTPTAISLPVTPGLLEQEPQLDEMEYEWFIRRNRAAVHAEPEPEPQHEPPSGVRTKADDAATDAADTGSKQDQDITRASETW